MKNIIPAFILFLSMHAKAINVLKIEEGIKTRQLSAQFSYNSGPKHKSISTLLTNNTTGQMCVVVDPGTLLESEFSNYQNHLITKRDTIMIKPNESRLVKLTGMCCERSDRGPSPNSRFTLIQNKRRDLIRLCSIIDSLKLSGYEAQTAIWCLADSSNPNTIYGGDSSVVMKLRHFVGKKLRKVVEPYNEAVYVRRVRSMPSIIFNGTGELMLDSIEVADKFVIELYDVDSDMKIQTIACNKIFIERKNLSLFISNIRLNNLNPETNYIVRLNKNGVVNMEWLYVLG